jgi:hypothetical protein
MRTTKAEREARAKLFKERLDRAEVLADLFMEAGWTVRKFVPRSTWFDASFTYIDVPIQIIVDVFNNGRIGVRGAGRSDRQLARSEGEKVIVAAGLGDLLV